MVLPCRVGNIQVSRPGKHGHAKMRVEGVGIVDGKKRIIVIPGHDSVEVPVIGKNTAQVLSVPGFFCKRNGCRDLRDF